jgi:hypothetical protein
MHIPTDLHFLPVAVPVVVVALVALIFIVIRRSRMSKISHDEMYSQFIPPIITGQNIPKEQTYIVPRNWKPPSSSVYAPLSIPIHQERNNIFSLPNIRPSELATKGIALIHALPPSKEAANGISPTFV